MRRGDADHRRWERTRGDENECVAERRLSREAESRGANMKVWWSQWLERSDEWRDTLDEDGLPLEASE